MQRSERYAGGEEEGEEQAACSARIENHVLGLTIYRGWGWGRWRAGQRATKERESASHYEYGRQGTIHAGQARALMQDMETEMRSTDLSRGQRRRGCASPLWTSTLYAARTNT